MRTSIEPLDLEAHAGTLHAWITHPRSVYWGMLDASPSDVVAEYARINEHGHHHAWLGRVDGEPAFLVETYDPAHSELAGLTHLPDLADGDLGMHVLVAPSERSVTGFTTTVFQAVMEHCFADESVRRVVVEPDVRNTAIRRKNTDAGFVELREIPMPGKTSMLSVCTREAFLAASTRTTATPGGAA